MQSNKYYVVWKGYAPGVYDSWEEAEIQVSGYPDAQYRAYKTQEAAVDAFREGYDKEGLIQEVARQMQNISAEGVKIEVKPQQPKPVPYLLDALAVDAACSGNPGPMEYRGVYVRTGQEIFRVGPLEQGTNNIGEFLAIVHALALCWQRGLHQKTIYSDSYNAILWVRKRQCKTKLERTPQTEQLYQIIARAEYWLRTHDYRNPIVKWETDRWGEVPADFGRKS